VLSKTVLQIGLGEKLEGLERFERFKRLEGFEGFKRFNRFKVWGAHKPIRSLCKGCYLLKCLKDLIGFRRRLQLFKRKVQGLKGLRGLRGLKGLWFVELTNLYGLRVKFTIY
jgi:hypothetical protein